MKDTKKIKNILVEEGTSIKKVMQVIDRGALNIAFVVNEKSQLIGAVSDGDIRRAIVKGCDINVPINGVMNRDPIVLKEKELSNRYIVRKTIKKLHNRMRDASYIPVVDSQNRPIKLARCLELIHAKEFASERHRNVRRVLVVGGAGFSGSILVKKLLEHEYSVKVLDMLMYGSESVKEFLRNEKYKLIKGDMRNITVLAKALDRIDAVINLAAIVGDPACKLNPSATIETNYLANKILAEACKYHQINRFIFASTCSVYGYGKSVLTEESPLNPLSLYARSKIQSEEGILSLEDENFSPTIFRLATLYGYSSRMRFDLVVNTMVRDAVCKKKVFIHGGGKQWRPLLHVEDAAIAYLKCLEAPIHTVGGEIFNVGSEKQNYQIVNISLVIKKLIPDIRVVKDESLHDSRDYFVSFEKIKTTLNFKPKYDLDYAIFEIRKAMESKKIRDANDSKYYNVEHMKGFQ